MFTAMCVVIIALYLFGMWFTYHIMDATESLSIIIGVPTHRFRLTQWLGVTFWPLLWAVVFTVNWWDSRSRA